MPGERTVLKGLIGHGNSSGDQAPWKCDEGNPILRAESNNTVLSRASIYNAL